MNARLSLVLAAAVMAAGCNTIPTTPDKYKSVTRFEDDNIYVARIENATAADGTMKVAVYGGATVTFDQKVMYRANWYDQDNFPIKTAVSNWNQINVDGNGMFEFYVVAPGPRAMRYLIEFKTD